MSERSDKPMIKLPGLIPGTSGDAMGGERRISPRFAFTADAEVFEVGSLARILGRSSDLGSDGCYIDTISPFAVGTALRVFLRTGLNEFEAGAVVRYSLPSMGMGLKFTDIKPEHRLVLREWIAHLSGVQSPDPEESATAHETVTPHESGAIPAVGNMRAVLIELINLMIRKGVISNAEGERLLLQLFR